MKGIIVTKENYNAIAGRMFKFFNNHPHIEEWHTFRGGMQKRIPRRTKVNFSLPDVEEEETKIIDSVIYNHYYNVKPSYHKNGKFNALHVKLDRNCDFNLAMDDEVWFLGNRIIIKYKFPFFSEYGIRYSYTTYQIGNSHPTKAQRAYFEYMDYLDSLHNDLL